MRFRTRSNLTIVLGLGFAGGVALLGFILASILWRAVFEPAPNVLMEPTPSEAATAEPVETPPPARFRLMQRGEVFGTDGCVNVRQEPALSAPINFCIQDGTQDTVIGGPVDADGHRWWRLDRYQGWAVEDYLRPAP